jgi:hypothetical protein
MPRERQVFMEASMERKYKVVAQLLLKARREDSGFWWWLKPD